MLFFSSSFDAATTSARCTVTVTDCQHYTAEQPPRTHTHCETNRILQMADDWACGIVDNFTSMHEHCLELANAELNVQHIFPIQYCLLSLVSRWSTTIAADGIEIIARWIVLQYELCWTWHGNCSFWQTAMLRNHPKLDSFICCCTRIRSRWPWRKMIEIDFLCFCKKNVFNIFFSPFSGCKSIDMI